MKDEWVRQSLFVFGALILPQAVLYLPEWRGLLVPWAALFVLLFIFTSRRKGAASLLIFLTFGTAVISAKLSTPAPSALNRLEAGIGGRGRAQRKAARLEVRCTVVGRVRYPSPGQVVFDCVESRAEHALRFRFSAGDLPWNGAWDITPGEEVQAIARIQPVAAAAYADQFSYQGYLFRRGIAATGDIESLVRRRPSAPVPDLPAQVHSRFESGDASAVMLAGVLGAKDLLNDELNLLFRRTGTSHLIVVSGFHVGVVFFALSFVIGQTVGRSVAVLSVQPLQPLSAAIAALAAWSYLLVVGAEISILRALVALTVFSFAGISGRDVCAPRTLSVTLGVTFLIWPGAFFEAGCQLTFLAVLGLLSAGASGRVLGFEGLPRIRRYLASNLLYSISAWLFTAPAVLLWFESFAPLAPLINLWAVPVFSAVTLLAGGTGIGAFAISPRLGSPLVALSIRGTDVFLSGLRACDNAASRGSLAFIELQTVEARSCALLITVLLAVLLYVVSCCAPRRSGARSEVLSKQPFDRQIALAGVVGESEHP